MYDIVDKAPSAFVISTKENNKKHFTTTRVKTVMASFQGSDVDSKRSQNKALLQHFEPLKNISSFFTLFKSGNFIIL